MFEYCCLVVVYWWGNGLEVMRDVEGRCRIEDKEELELRMGRVRESLRLLFVCLFFVCFLFWILSFFL